MRLTDWIGPTMRAPATALLFALLVVPPIAAAQSPGVASASGTATVPADVPLYQVELVIFRTEGAVPPEDWGSAPNSRGFGTLISSGAPTPQMVHTLSSSDYRLDGVIRGLRSSGYWRPIAHVAWVQTAPPWGSHTGLSLSALGVDAPGLSGNVYLERAKLYLHLGFDVTLQEGANAYRIDEMRNIRSNEKQYYDHPAFGIIAAVYPIKRAGR